MLNPAQFSEVQKECVKNGVPVRFLKDGRNLDIITGDLQPKSINVMNQLTYWHFTKETSKKIAGWLGARPVFDKK